MPGWGRTKSRGYVGWCCTLDEAVLTGATFFAWGEIFSLFPAAIGDVYGPDWVTTNYGVQYTAKGVASIFAGWGAARLVELAGTWIPIFWVAAGCDLLAALLALFWLKPLVARVLARPASPDRENGRRLVAA